MELKAYIAPLIKWWWLLVAAAVLAAVTSFITVRQEPAQYQSSTTLMIGQIINDPNPSGNQLFLGQQLAEAYADVAERIPVREATMAALNLDELPTYEAQALPNRPLIQITVLDTDPERAQAVAAELANQLIRLSPGGAEPGEQQRQVFITAQLDKLEGQITATEEEIQAKQAELGELFSASEIARAENEVAALQSKLQTLQSTYAGLLSGTREAINTLTIIEPAYLPRRPVGSGALLTIASATAIALVVAAGTAYLLEYLDDTVKTPEQISKRFGLPTVATIAKFETEDRDSDLVMVNAPRSPEAEGFRGLRTAIQYADEEPLQSLLITSPHQSDGKSVVAGNLALALAQGGQRTLLIDGDLRRPMQHELFNLRNQHGLGSLLLDPQLLEGDDADAIETRLFEKGIILPTAEENLWVMTSGKLRINPAEVMSSTATRTIFDFLSARYDVLILDTPPALAVTDAVVLSRHVNKVFVLVSANQTRKAELDKVLDRLGSVNAPVAGIILNHVSVKSHDYYYSYYRYSDYAEEPAEEETREEQEGSWLQRPFGTRSKHASSRGASSPIDS